MFQPCDISREPGEAEANWWGLRSGDTGSFPCPWPMRLTMRAEGVFSGAVIVTRDGARITEPDVTIKLGWAREFDFSVEGGDAETKIRLKVKADHGRAAQKKRHSFRKYQVA